MNVELDVRTLLAKSLEQFRDGDPGAPFERPLLQALLQTRQENPAELHRLQGELLEAGVSIRDLNAALKLEQTRQKSEQIPAPGIPRFTADQISEMEKKGFVVDAAKGITDINPNLFAKYVLRMFELRYSTGQRFFLYEQGVWRHLAEKELQRRLVALIEAIQADVWRPAWENGYITALERLAEHVNRFDTQRRYLNLANGMFDTEKFKLLEHHPAFHSSIRTPLSYDPGARCPRFVKFLNEVFQGDQQLIAVVQEILGYCCTAETRAQVMFIFEGIGSNGKSVLIEIMEHLCGKPNVSHVAMNELIQPFARGELVGKLLNVSSENEFNERGLSTQHIKSITVGDPIRVEIKFQSGFSYSPVCKLVYGMNTLPSTMDKSHGFFRRLVIVPFRRVFKSEEADKTLLDKLLEELPGIFNFAMEGLRRLRERDFIFTESDAIGKAVSSYKSEQNPVIPFVTDFVEAGSESDRTGKNELFDQFQTWCRQHGEPDFASKTVRDRRVFWTAFRNALLEVGLSAPEERTSNGTRYLYGLTLLKHAKPSMADLFEEDAELDAPAETLVTTSSNLFASNRPRVPFRKPFGEKKPMFVESDRSESEALPVPDNVLDESDDEGRLTDWTTEEEFDQESIQFDINFIPARVLHGLSVTEWLDGKPEVFDLEDFCFESRIVNGIEFVSLQ